MMGSKCFCFGLAKNISILMVFLQNRRKVDFLEVVDLAYIVEQKMLSSLRGTRSRVGLVH